MHRSISLAKTKNIFLILLSLGFVTAQVARDTKPARSRTLAPVIRSLIIPGTGEFQLGQIKRGRGFLLTETLFLVSIYTSRKAADYQDNALRGWAAEHANVIHSGKPDQFWVDIGNYATRDAYNEEHQRWRDLDNLYDVTPEWNWTWDSAKNRRRFEAIRINRDKWQIAGKFLIGGIVLNHFVSAIDALYLARVLNDGQLSVLPVITGNLAQPGISLTLRF